MFQSVLHSCSFGSALEAAVRSQRRPQGWFHCANQRPVVPATVWCRLAPFGVKEWGVMNAIEVNCMYRWERSSCGCPWCHLSLAVMRDVQPWLKH